MDLSKAYEHIPWALLVARARELGFDMMLLRLLIRLYALPRLVTVDGAAMGWRVPQRGAVAGCSFADLCMRIFH
eukprot:3317802-Pyramimonas_sp.AAC.1